MLYKIQVFVGVINIYKMCRVKILTAKSSSDHALSMFIIRKNMGNIWAVLYRISCYTFILHDDDNNKNKNNNNHNNGCKNFVEKYYPIYIIII